VIPEENHRDGHGVAAHDIWVGVEKCFLFQLGEKKAKGKYFYLSISTYWRVSERQSWT